MQKQFTTEVLTVKTGVDDQQTDGLMTLQKENLSYNSFERIKYFYIFSRKIWYDSKKSDEKIRLTWETAYAGDEPVKNYEVIIDGEIIGLIDHYPQTLKSKPIVFETEKSGSEILVAVYDMVGNRVETKLS